MSPNQPETLELPRLAFQFLLLLISVLLCYSREFKPGFAIQAICVSSSFSKAPAQIVLQGLHSCISPTRSDLMPAANQQDRRTKSLQFYLQVCTGHSFKQNPQAWMCWLASCFPSAATLASPMAQAAKTQEGRWRSSARCSCVPAGAPFKANYWRQNC